MSMISVQDVTREFKIAQHDPIVVLNHVNAEVPEGKFTILRGPSGSGKTTLMNMLGALDRPNGGTILFDGKDITKMSDRERERLRRKQIGFIFQSVSLIPIMTAYENVEFALRMSGAKMSQKERRERVEHCLSIVGLGKRMNHMPQELSGGEQQRVAIARAIAHKPKVIFADEPTAELDSVSSLVVVNIFKELVSKEGVTIVMTTHDVGLMNTADSVFQIEDGEIING